jgi:hypothetical protein
MSISERVLRRSSWLFSAWNFKNFYEFSFWIFHYFFIVAARIIECTRTQRSHRWRDYSFILFFLKKWVFFHQNIIYDRNPVLLYIMIIWYWTTAFLCLIWHRVTLKHIITALLLFFARRGHWAITFIELFLFFWIITC